MFMLPSYREESYPLAVMEAMDQGLPAITTARRGCADLLEADVHGVFAPARQALTLARAIERLLDDEEMRARMGRANLAKVAQFAPDRVVPRYAEILRASAVRDGCGRGIEGAGTS